MSRTVGFAGPIVGDYTQPLLSLAPKDPAYRLGGTTSPFDSAAEHRSDQLERPGAPCRVHPQHPARGRLIGTATRLLCPVSITGGRSIRRPHG